MNTTDLIRNLPALKRGYEEHKTGKIHRVLKKRIADGRAAERTAKELGSVEQLIDRKLSPVADTIRAQQAEIDAISAMAAKWSSMAEEGKEGEGQEGEGEEEEKKP